MAGSTAGGEQVFTGVCRPNCFAYCQMNVHVRDGKVVRTSKKPYANESINRICLRGLSHPQRIYSTERIKYPMKRAGERGEDQWERITWDEAVETVTTRFKEIQEQYGKQAVSVFMGSGNNAVINGNLAGMTPRFQNAINATNMEFSIDSAYTLGLSRVTGALGNWPVNDPQDWVNAKTIIVWGCTLTDAQIQEWHFMADALVVCVI